MRPPSPRTPKLALAASLLAALALSAPLIPAIAAPPAAPPASAPRPSGPMTWYQEVSKLMAQADRSLSGGDHEAAILLLERALAISEENKNDEYIALVLGQLTFPYTAKRDPAKVDEMHRRIIAIREKKDGPSHPLVGMSLLNYGNFCRQTGQLEKAEGLLKRAAAIYEAAGGPSGLSAALALNELALVNVSLGKQPVAEELLARALALQEKVQALLNIEVPAIGNTLTNMAILAHHAGELERALELGRRACALVEKAAKTPDHYSVAQCAHNIGLVHVSRGDFPAAKELLDRAFGVWQRALGPEHPRLTVSLNAIAAYHEAKGEIDKSLAVLERSADINDRDLDLVLASGSEGQKRDFISRIAGQTDAILSLHGGASRERDAAGPNAASSRALALRTILRRKGRILDAVAGNAAVLRRRMSAEDRALFDELGAARAELSRLILGGLRSSDEGNKARAEALKQTIERLEAELSRRSASFRAATQPVSIERVREAIPEGALLIEIAKYRPFNAAWKTMAEAWRPARYAAFLLSRDAEPESVDLGEAKAIDDAVARFRRALGARGGAPGSVKALARELDEKVLRPILGKARAPSAEPAKNQKPSMLMISPAGSLNLIPFGALVDESDRYRVESYPIVYFTTGRDLLRLAASPGGVAAAQKTGAPGAPSPQAAPNAPQAAPVVIGHPGFGDPAPRPAGGSSSRQTIQMTFTPLPGTAEEAQAIASVLAGSTLLTGARATEAAVKGGRAPYVLHIATHGFFLGDLDAGSQGSGERALQLEMSVPAAGAGNAPRMAMLPIEQPLLRSGLAFAGANRRDATGDDGILTALEASGLDLWGTELVVLSACETGLGDVTEGEGVYGLRRSLIIAGSRSQVMSLWKVDDEATRDLMVDYYRRLSVGHGRAQALRGAQLAMLGVADRAHPFYWASFIPSGDWRSLHLAPPPPIAKPAAPAPPQASPGARGCGCSIPGLPSNSSSALLGLLALAVVAARVAGSRARRPFK